MLSILKFVLRVSGCIVLAIAIVAGVSDASSSIAQSQIVLAPLGQVWFELSPETLNTSQAVVQRYVHPTLWDPVIQTLLTWPAWVVLAPLGMLLLWGGASERKQTILFT
ncbi:MAG: hypothetical protein ABJJ37_12410 [Roseibium sp.]